MYNQVCILSRGGSSKINFNPVRTFLPSLQPLRSIIRSGNCWHYQHFHQSNEKIAATGKSVVRMRSINEDTQTGQHETNRCEVASAKIHTPFLMSSPVNLEAMIVPGLSPRSRHSRNANRASCAASNELLW